jgi:hypothetical protein
MMKLRSLFLAAFVFLALPFASSFAQVGISINIAPAGSAGIRAAALSRRRLHLDSRLLGLGRRQLLLGTRRVGTSAGNRFALDSSVVGLE